MSQGQVKALDKHRPPEENLVVIDASGHIAGRLATVAAKLALMGKRVIVVNAQDAVVTGDPNMVINWFKKRITEIRTHYNPEKVGPKWPRRPDRVLRRIIRGMLPHKQYKGREALRRVKVYLGVPKEYFNAPKYIIPDAVLKPRPGIKYVTLGDVWRAIEPLKYEAWRRAYERYLTEVNAPRQEAKPQQ